MLEEQGYCIERKLLDKYQINRVLDDIGALAKRQAADAFGTLFGNLDYLLWDDKDAYLETIRSFHRLASVQALMLSAPILDKLKDLGFEQPSLPTSPVVIAMSDQLKTPGGYHGLAPHQDWTSTQGSLDTVTVWVPLHDVSRDNFPLEVIPRSHLRGVWPGKRNGSYYEIDKSEYKDSDFVPLEVKQGDVVIMSGFTVHRTGVKDSKGLRIAASIRFDNSAEPSFIKRNYPCMYSRTLKQEWQDDNLPGVEEMKGVFGI